MELTVRPGRAVVAVSDFAPLWRSWSLVLLGDPWWSWVVCSDLETWRVAATSDDFFAEVAVGQYGQVGCGNASGQLVRDDDWGS